MKENGTYGLWPLKNLMCGRAFSSAAGSSLRPISDAHPRSHDIVRNAEVLIIGDLIDPDLLPLMADRRAKARPTFVELADEPCREGREDGMERDVLLRLMIQQADGVRFHHAALLEQYGTLNPRYALMLKKKTVHYEPHPFEVLILKGMTMAAEKKREAALDFFAEAGRLCPESPLPFVLEAPLSPAPIESLKKALALNPSSVTAWTLLADEHLKAKDWPAALAALESAVSIAPDNPLPYLRAARVLRLLSKKKEWLHLLQKAQSCSGNHFSAAVNNGSGNRSVSKPTPRTKRVLFMAGEKSMVFQDCREGFEELGWETGQELFSDTSHQTPDAHERLAIRIRSFQPHLVISINQVGCDREGFILSALKGAGIPTFLWYVDSPFALLPEDHPAMVREATLLGTFDSSYVEALKERTGVKAVHLPLGTNPKRFQPPARSAPESDWTVSFIGNLDLEKVSRRREALKEDDPSALERVDEAVRHLIGAPFSSAHDILEKYAAGPDWNDLSRPLREKIYQIAEMEASAKRRLEIVTRLKEEGIRVVGGAEWKRYINSGHWIPPVDYLTGLCGIYQRTRIVLNISRYQLRAGVTQRVFDVPAAGGFLMTDRTAEVERYLLPEEEVVFYEDPADLKDKTAYYLNHDRERRNISAKARKRVLQEHTYGHRIKSIIAALGLG
jgi:spore maturation protein CgeB